MKIAIDAITFSHPQPGGYRTYTLNLINHLSKVATEDRFYLLVDRPLTLKFPANWCIRVLPSRLPWVGVALREQTQVPLYVNRDEADLLHSPCATGPLWANHLRVVTVLDTIEFSTPLPSPRFPRFLAMRLYSRFVQLHLARVADLIITISQYSKSQIANRFGINPNKIVVTHLAAAEAFHQVQTNKKGNSIAHLLDLERYVLAFASASPRKNIPRLLESYASLATTLRQSFPLVLICSHPLLKKQLREKVANLDIQSNVIFLERVLDSQLVELYRRATVFIFPSIEEGFGLPPLEAMATGTAVVASNTSSLPEVLGDAALLVSPTDTQALAKAMEELLTTPKLVSELAERGRNRSRMFSWENTANQTIAAYHSLIST